MDHRGETLFPGDGVTLGWDLNIRLDGRMARGVHLPFQPFVRHLRYFGSLKELNSLTSLVDQLLLNFGGWFNYLLFFRAGWSA